MSNTCCDCSKKITGTRFRGVQCTGHCKKYFHLKCITIQNIDESLENGSFIWTCPSCKMNNQTAIDVGPKLSNSSNTSLGSSTIDDIQTSIANLSNRFGGLEDSQRFLSNSVEALRNELKYALDEVKSLKTIVKKIDDDCNSLRQRVNHLESLYDQSVQNKLVNNIVISGIPVNNHDNKELIMNVLSCVHPEIINTEVLDVIKVRADVNKPKTTNEMYIVKLSSTELKTTILNKMKSFKNFTSDDLGIAFSSNLKNKIFIMHHLTPLQSKLYKQAKLIKREKNFRYLWIRNGAIMLRQNESSQVYHIRSFNGFDQFHNPIP